MGEKYWKIYCMHPVGEEPLGPLCYVGRTSQPLKRRISKHLSEARKGSDRRVYTEMRRVGPEKFTMVELEEVIGVTEGGKRELFWKEKRLARV